VTLHKKLPFEWMRQFPIQPATALPCIHKGDTPETTPEFPIFQFISFFWLGVRHVVTSSTSSSFFFPSFFAHFSFLWNNNGG